MRRISFKQSSNNKGCLTEQASQNWQIGPQILWEEGLPCKQVVDECTMPFLFFWRLAQRQQSTIASSAVSIEISPTIWLEAVILGSGDEWSEGRSSCASGLLAHRKWRMKWNEIDPLLDWSVCCQGESYGSTIYPPPRFPVVFGFRNGCWGLGIPEAKPKKNHSNFTIYGKHTQGSNQRLSPACPPNHNQNSNHPISTICPHIETLPKKNSLAPWLIIRDFSVSPMLHITSEPTT